MLGKAFSIPMSSELTFHALGLLPFSGSFSVMMFLWESMFAQRILFASPDLIAVSFNSLRKVAVFLPEPAISVSNSSSVGMKGIFRVTLHLGFSQVNPCIFRKRL